MHMENILLVDRSLVDKLNSGWSIFPSPKLLDGAFVIEENHSITTQHDITGEHPKYQSMQEFQDSMAKEDDARVWNKPSSLGLKPWLHVPHVLVIDQDRLPWLPTLYKHVLDGVFAMDESGFVETLKNRGVPKIPDRGDTYLMYQAIQCIGNMQRIKSTT